VARQGINAYKNHRVIEALSSFHSYIRVLEELKGVREGCLNPSNFNVKEDLSELLLISGVYWDLVKIYDRTKSPEKFKDFQHYLNQYVTFSKGLPYHALCAESLRKYLAYGNPQHKSDLNAAYRMLAQNRCFVATALADVLREETIPTLRDFRDQTLKKTSGGRWVVLQYYKFGPSVGKFVQNLPSPVRKVMGAGIDFVAQKIRR
jgi:hypothetical protein